MGTFFGGAGHPNQGQSSVRHARRGLAAQNLTMIAAIDWCRENIGFEAGQGLSFECDRSMRDLSDRPEVMRGRTVASASASHFAAEESPGSIGQVAR